MGMRETERSVRAYFLFAGTVSVLLGLRDASELSKLDGVTLPLEWLAAIYIPMISQFVLGAAFFVAGLKIRMALPRGAGWIRTLLVAAGVMLIANGVLVTTVVGSEKPTVFGGPIIGLLIIIYLHRSVTRLASEAAAREGIPPPPPTAQVHR